MLPMRSVLCPTLADKLVMRLLKTRLLGVIVVISIPLNCVPVWATWPELNTHSIQHLESKESILSYQFVVTGDNRKGNAIFAKILNQAKAYHPHFMLHTGDFVGSGQKIEYLNFMALIKKSPFPVLTAVGNHEILNQGRYWYQHYFGKSYFSFAYGPDRFIILDNANDELSAGQLKWLEEALKKPARYRFLVMHQPPRNVIWFHAFDKGAKKLMALASKYKVNYVFMGHAHIYDRMEYQNVIYIISGSAGAPMYRMPLYISPEGGAFQHFVSIQVSDQGIQEEIVKIQP